MAVLAALAGILAYALIHLALIELGQEVVVLHERTPDGERRARLWIVDDGEMAWLHYGSPDWIRQLGTQPILEIERGGGKQRFRGTPDPEADPQVHRLLREKYGLADRLVRFWAGSATEPGLLSGSTCTATPVRLESP